MSKRGSPSEISSTSRSKKVKQMLGSCLGETLDNFSYEKVAQCYPTLAKEQPERLQQALSQVKEFLKTNTEEEFEAILEQRNILEKLDELDDIIAKAKKCQKDGHSPIQPMINVDPKTIIRAKTLPIKFEEKKNLEREFLKINQENESLMSEVRIKKKQIDCLSQSIQEIITENDKVGQLYAVAEASKAETGGGEGVEVLKNEPYENAEGKGQYTYKIYHLSSKVPAIIRAIAPSGALELYEEAWNAYPHCKTVLTDNFKLVTETMHVDNSRGEIDNALNISQDLLEKREVVIIDIANDPIEPKDYKKDQDPTLYHSEKTGRGPLKDDWIKKATPTMTCYKLVTVEFKWFGLQNKIESFIQNVMRSLFTNFHRQLFCWTDKWYGMTMDDIRAYEDKTKYDLDESRAKAPPQEET
ncbi:21039_t:CDS:2 [Rhizophagus irregularis]|nr:21039_t:CDS:2 [Rhizophagus irregularis]